MTQFYDFAVSSQSPIVYTLNIAGFISLAKRFCSVTKALLVPSAKKFAEYRIGEPPAASKGEAARTKRDDHDKKSNGISQSRSFPNCIRKFFSPFEQLLNFHQTIQGSLPVMKPFSEITPYGNRRLPRPAWLSPQGTYPASPFPQVRWPEKCSDANVLIDEIYYPINTEN